MATTIKYHSAICLVRDVGVITTIVREINKGVRGTKKEKDWSPSGFWFLSRKKHCDGYQEKFNVDESTLSFLWILDVHPMLAKYQILVKWWPQKSCSWEILRNSAFQSNKRYLLNVNPNVCLTHKWIEQHLCWELTAACVQEFFATIQVQTLTKGPDDSHSSPKLNVLPLVGYCQNYQKPRWAIIRNVRGPPEGHRRQTQGWSLLIVLSTLVSP